jgi:hypothetical protein
VARTVVVHGPDDGARVPPVGVQEQADRAGLHQRVVHGQHDGGGDRVAGGAEAEAERVHLLGVPGVVPHDVRPGAAGLGLGLGGGDHRHHLLAAAIRQRLDGGRQEGDVAQAEEGLGPTHPFGPSRGQHDPQSANHA